jgi:plastocyanin
VPKLASNSVGGSGVGVKGGWLWPLAAAFACLPLFCSFSAVATAQSSSEQSASADEPIAAEIVGEPSATIKMGDDEPMYQPSSLIIETGQTVEWKNYGAVSHSVNDDPRKAQKPDDALLPVNADAFASGNVMPGGSYRHIFLVPGRYRYFCLSHEIDKMIGEIIVKPPPLSISKSPPPSISSRHRFEFSRVPPPSAKSKPHLLSRPWSALERTRTLPNTADGGDE